MSSIVVDTNVFIHSNNPENEFFDQAVSFLEDLENSTFDIYVDEGLNADEARNTSRIWSEYLRHIPSSTLARSLLAQLLISSRVLDVAAQVDQRISKVINQNVKDKSDRIFVKVAYNSRSESLVSHDDAAFPTALRKRFRKLGIANIVDCTEQIF